MSYPTDASGETGNENAAGAVLVLCPLLVLATSVIDALGLAVVAFAAFVVADVIIALIRRWIADATRWPATMLAIGLCTSAVMLLLQAFAFDLYQRIALLVPIVITNWFVLARMDRAPRGGSFAISTVTAPLAAAAALVIVGAVCEALAYGTLLAGIAKADLQIRIADSGFLLASMPSGAFIIAGLLLAACNARVHPA